MCDNQYLDDRAVRTCAYEDFQQHVTEHQCSTGRAAAAFTCFSAMPAVSENLALKPSIYSPAHGSHIEHQGLSLLGI